MGYEFNFNDFDPDTDLNDIQDVPTPQLSE